jgi:hypothetical protein
MRSLVRTLALWLGTFALWLERATWPHHVEERVVMLRTLVEARVVVVYRGTLIGTCSTVEEAESLMKWDSAQTGRPINFYTIVSKPGIKIAS